MEPWLYNTTNPHSMTIVEPQPVGLGESPPQQLRTEAMGRPGMSPNFFQLARLAGIALGAYHGYRRTNSTTWAFGWSLFGGAMPFFAIPLAFAQGFGKRKGRGK